MGWFKRLLGIEDLPPAEVLAIDDTNFKKEVLQSDLPVLLDVWSDGCVPCRQLMPIVVDLSRRYAGRVKVAELNAGRGPKTTRKLSVRGTPTVIYFYKGRVMERIVGFRGSLYHTDYLDNELLPRIEGRPQVA